MEIMAYLDAGTGSIVIQAIFGAVLGVVLVLRTKLRSLFVRIFKSGRVASRKNTEA